MPSKISKTKLKMRMTRTTSAKPEASSQPPAKTIKTSAEIHHYQKLQRQKSQEDSASSDSQSKLSLAPSVQSHGSSSSSKVGPKRAVNLQKNNLQQQQQNKTKYCQSSANNKQLVQKESHPPADHQHNHHHHQKSSQSSVSSEEKHCELDGPIYKRYTIKTRLGKGAYGIVWEAYEKTTGNKVALKKIFDAFRNDTDAQRTYREIMFLREFGNHPNIIRLLNVHRAVNNMDIYLVFPFMEHDLHRLIKESPQSLKDGHIRMIFYQTLKAVKYLHSGEVIHRDLKPANILLDDYLNVKVADFGLARSLFSPDDSMSEVNPVMTDYVATRWYRPPEILLSCPYYTKGVDMWSLGCILGEMILKVPLFPGGSTGKTAALNFNFYYKHSLQQFSLSLETFYKVHQVETIMAHIAPPSAEEIEEMCGQNVQTTMIESAMVYRKKSLAEIFERCDPDMVNLIEKFLVFNPAKRITAEETLAHPYLARYRRPSEEMIMSHPVSPPLNDYVQLPMCQYRSVIYDLIHVRKTRQPQQQPQFFLYPQQTQTDNLVPVSASKSKSYSQAGTNVPGNANTSAKNDARRARSTVAPDASKVNPPVVASKAQLNARNGNEVRDPRKCYSVKTIQTTGHERVRTASSADLSPKLTTKTESKSTAAGFECENGNDSVGNVRQECTNVQDSNTEKGSFKQPTRKNVSTPNIPHVRKIPGPDGDGHDMPFPYLKLVSTAPGLQGKNPRLFDRSELSARTTHPVPSDLRGAEKRLYEIYSHTEDLEEEIKAIEYEVRAKRVTNSAQAQWIADLSTNLHKTTVSDTPNNFQGSVTNQVLGREGKHSTASQYQGSTIRGAPSRVLQQTKLPEILQSWNQGLAKVHSNSTESVTKQGRRSTYFQDPPVTNSSGNALYVAKSASGIINQRTLTSQARISQLSPKEYSLQQRTAAGCYPHQNNAQHSQYSRCTTPIEVTNNQARSKHYESYSQTHGTISASDLTELKANIGFLGKP